MQLIVFSCNPTHQSDQWFEFWKTNSPLGRDPLFFQSIEGLRAHLKNSGYQQIMALLYVQSESEMEQLLGLQKIMTNTWKILVLPNGQANIVKMGLKLLPRYIAYADEAFGHILQVMEKLRETHLRKQHKTMAPQLIEPSANFPKNDQ